MVDSAKVAGILLERAENAVVIGFGVNLAFAPMVPERQTTSLLGRIFSVDADRFVEDLAGEVRLWLHKWRTEGLASVIERWEQMAHTRGAVLSVRLPNHEKVVGRFDGLDPDGALILRLADGARRAIHAGDVFWSDPHAARD